MRPFRSPMLVLAAMAMLAMLAWSLRGPFAGLAANRWRRQLDDAPAGRAEALASQMAQLGRPGIRALVDALGSKREVTATAARQALWAELERWEGLTAPAVTRNLAVLAEALAEGAEQFGPAARRDAADLATEVLRWLPDSHGPDRIEVIAHCDRVFDYAASNRAAASLAAVSAGRTPFEHEGAFDGAPPDPGHPPLETPEMPSVVRSLPGGGLPMETLPLPGLAREPAGKRTAEGRRRAAEPVPCSENGEPAPLMVTPGGPLLPDGVRPLSATESLPLAPRPPELPAGIADAAAGEPAPDGEFDAMETDVLMRWVHAADATVAGRAEGALRRRGFTDVHLELARRLFDPAPDVRIELARTLPKLTSIDPVPWLLWLSRDPDARVRRTAIGLMATTADPALHARIRQMAREDSDPAVQRVARRLDGHYRR